MEVTGATVSLFAATDEALRANAAVTWINLIRKCSDSETSKAILGALNGVLDGKSGKLTVPEQRTNVFRIYAAFGKAPLSASSKSAVLALVCEKLAAQAKAVRMFWLNIVGLLISLRIPTRRRLSLLF
jgi:hypothetical protein